METIWMLALPHSIYFSYLGKDQTMNEEDSTAT
jgi:hypothetical protein